MLKSFDAAPDLCSPSARRRGFRPVLLAALTAVVLAGCVSNEVVRAPQSGFLSPVEYGRLKNAGSPAPGTTLYRYVSPDFKRSDYKALLIDPVLLHEGALKDEGKNGLNDDTVRQVRALIDTELKTRAAQRIAVVSQPGAGVAQVTVALTGAQVEGDGFKPRNVVPVSAVLLAAQKATGTDSKTPSMVVEARVRDSVSGKVLSESVYVVQGETFRSQSSAPEAFKKLALDWVTTAVNVASGAAGN